MSEDGVTSTCDPKHIFKQLATLLCKVVVFIVNDINIRASDIVEQLVLLPDMTLEKACQLLDPSDKQNVPKAVALLQSLLQIKQLSKSPDPTINRRRDAISFVAEIFGYFLRPFITVDMS